MKKYITIHVKHEKIDLPIGNASVRLIFPFDKSGDPYETDVEKTDNYGDATFYLPDRFHERDFIVQVDGNRVEKKHVNVVSRFETAIII
ncbi:MAG: hypothetical protein V1928_02150 [Parcubacteria group bacterium]